MFKALINRLATRIRPSIFQADGEVDVVAATVKIMVPVAGALACYFALSPSDWNVSEDVKELITSLWWFALLGLHIYAATAVLMFLAIKTAIEMPETPRTNCQRAVD